MDQLWPLKSLTTRWCPSSESHADGKIYLVNSMVYGRYIELVTMVSQHSHHWGHHLGAKEWRSIEIYDLNMED